MLVIRTVYFTENGRETLVRLNSAASDFIFEEKPQEANLKLWTLECFKQHLPILFIGSTGIAVRTIASFVENKLTDSPVLVVDELGQNVIPVLSGHYGGANEIAVGLAAAINATPIITTATDINGAFAVDVFAKKNGLRITNKDKIKEVSSKVLKGEKLRFFEDRNHIKIDDLELVPKRIVLGIGCKKGKSFQDLKEFINESYDDKYLRENLYGICSIDVKEGELGLIKLAQYYGVDFKVFSAEKLQGIPGDFQESDFVSDTVGVGNVCERAAICGAGKGAVLVKNKIAKNGITLAEARREFIELDWLEKKWQDVFM
jgi:cobalt-precorrin 5A hydrolase